MKKYLTLILILGSLNAFGQSIQTITNKVSQKICDCMSYDMESYSDIKPEFNKCYDKVFNKIFSIADSAERKILVQPASLEKVNQGILRALNENCEKIREIIKSNIDSTVETSSSHTTDPCLTNFTGDDIKKLNILNGETIAFNGLITEVHSAHKDKPYYQVKLEGGNTIWIASLVNSGFEKVGKIVRILGYVAKVGEDTIAKKYNKTDYHVLAFCIIDMETKQMAMLPGSELQVKEWINGKIPEGAK